MDAGIQNNVALQQVLATLEVERKHIAATQTKGYLFLAGGIAIAIIGSIMGFLVPAIVVGLVPAIAGIVFLYKISDQLKAYKQTFKLEVIGSALKSLDQSLNIHPEDGIQMSEFMGSQLFKQDPDRYHTEDLVSGTAGKTGLYFAEVHAEYKTEVQTKNGRQEQWHDIFRGIVFVADFNKNFNGVTVVRPKDMGAAFGAWFTKNLFSFGDKDLIELENVEFNKTFVTYATDQVEGRYILTPALMERILQLNRNSKNHLSMSFIDSRMYIAFPLDRNYFEAPVFKTLLNPDLLNQDIAAIKFMYGIVAELDLNTRIWGKS